MRRFGFKPSLRDQRRASIAAQRIMLAGMDPSDPRYAANVARLEKDEASIPPKRMRSDAVDIDAVHRGQAAPLEKEIQRTILDYLRKHPKVAFVGRFNSGAAQSSYNGQASFVRFHTVRGFPDIHGMLKGGAAFYFEVKRPGAKLTDDQARFLMGVREYGGIGAMVTSVEDVIAALG